jgi:hypothetical protein
MPRRATVLLSVSLFGWLIAAPQLSFAQSNSLIGTWKLNLEKSKTDPGPPARALTQTIELVGQGVKITGDGIDASGNPIKVELGEVTEDGTFRPSKGSSVFDATAITQIDANTRIIARTKAGKLVQVSTVIVAPDGKTFTSTIAGIDSSGRKFNSVAIYDKQ